MRIRTHRTFFAVLVVSSVGALFAACGDDDSAGPGDGGSFTGTIRVLDNRFSPASVTISVGDSVTWSWEGNNAHTVTHGTSPGNVPVPQLFDEGPKTSGTLGFRFTQAGTVPYFCEPHFAQGMTGSITVQP